MKRRKKAAPSLEHPEHLSELTTRSVWGSSRRFGDGWTERCLVNPARVGQAPAPPPRPSDAGSAEPS